MERVFKITTNTGTTRQGVEWREGIAQTASGRCPVFEDGPPELLWAFRTALRASLLWPYQCNYAGPVPSLWQCDGEVVYEPNQTEVGCTILRTIRQVELPDIQTAARVRTAIQVALLKPCSPSFTRWAALWLSGEDRTAASAEATARTTAAEMGFVDREWLWLNAPGHVGTRGPSVHALCAAQAAALEARVAAVSTSPANVLDVIRAKLDELTSEYQSKTARVHAATAFASWARHPVTAWAQVADYWAAAIKSSRSASDRQLREQGAEYAKRALDGFSLDKIIVAAVEDERRLSAA